MRRFLVMGCIALLAFGFGGYRAVRFFAEQPLYEPGDVSKQRDVLFEQKIRDIDDQYWEVEKGVQLHHFSEGEGRNVLVLHGGPGFPFIKPLPGLERLTNNYRFHYYDQRGCGKSSRPIDTFTSNNFYENAKALEMTLGLTAQIADIERVRRYLQEEKLILVGHSFGAFLAALYAAEFPEQVEALVLVAPANVLVLPQAQGDLFNDVKGLLPADMLVDFDSFQTRYFDFSHLFENSEDDLIKLNTEFVQYYDAAMAAKGIQVPKSPPEYDETMNGGWMVQAMYMSMGKKHDYRAALNKVTAPVLVLHGENDTQTESVSREYSNQFHNARLEVVKDASHFIYAEQPQVFSQVASYFLDEFKK